MTGEDREKTAEERKIHFILFSFPFFFFLFFLNKETPVFISHWVLQVMLVKPSRSHGSCPSNLKSIPTENIPWIIPTDCALACSPSLCILFRSTFNQCPASDNILCCGSSEIV